MKLLFISLGCDKNLVDSEVMLGMLTQKGYEITDDEEQADDSIAVKEMFMLAVATSIDALAVGITFAFLNVHIVSAASMIGVCTFLISFAGVKIGNIFGTKYKSKAELAGGIILILLGFKILFEHLHIL